MIGSVFFRVYEKTGIVYAINVLPGYRGKGIGQELLEKCIASLQQKGVKKIMLKTKINNFPALALYAKMGFEFAGVLNKHYNNEIDAVEMILKL